MVLLKNYKKITSNLKSMQILRYCPTVKHEHCSFKEKMNVLRMYQVNEVSLVK